MSFLGLFEGYGIELEYMIVDRSTLQIRPISDQILTAAAGELTSDFEDGAISWSNELVLHVLELKTSGPAQSLANLESEFSRSLKFINSLLAKHDACLMPTAMHPFMHPSEMRLWPHDNNEIYAAYNRIFDCRGHGWSNLQSMHINLPFRTDEEFFRLHNAIRFLLPILPALTASSPVVEGVLTGTADSRLVAYQQNQIRVPIIAGQVIPESVKSIEDYKQKILAQIYTVIAPHDPECLLRDDWLNSRGAISRFGRQTIEIRVLDLQEAPLFDLSLADLICTTLKSLVNGKLIPITSQEAFSTTELKDLFDLSVRNAEQATITNPKYAAAFNVPQSITLQELWLKIHASVSSDFMSAEHASVSKQLITAGSLSSRIQKALGHDPSPKRIADIYQNLCSCLNSNRMFGIE